MTELQNVIFRKFEAEANLNCFEAVISFVTWCAVNGVHCNSKLGEERHQLTGLLHATLFLLQYSMESYSRLTAKVAFHDPRYGAIPTKVRGQKLALDSQRRFCKPSRDLGTLLDLLTAGSTKSPEQSAHGNIPQFRMPGMTGIRPSFDIHSVGCFIALGQLTAQLRNVFSDLIFVGLASDAEIHCEVRVGATRPLFYCLGHRTIAEQMSHYSCNHD